MWINKFIGILIAINQKPPKDITERILLYPKIHYSTHQTSQTMMKTQRFAISDLTFTQTNGKMEKASSFTCKHYSLKIY